MYLSAIYPYHVKKNKKTSNFGNLLSNFGNYRVISVIPSNFGKYQYPYMSPVVSRAIDREHLADVCVSVLAILSDSHTLNSGTCSHTSLSKPPWLTYMPHDHSSLNLMTAH